jgi:hypothetical protein
MNMMRGVRKELQKVIAAHTRYLETYKRLNNGSTVGATPLQDYYIMWVYTSRYRDMRIFALVSYR